MGLVVGVGLQIQFVDMNPKKFLNFPLSPLSNSHLKSLDLKTKSLVDERETFSLLGISSQSIFSLSSFLSVSLWLSFIRCGLNYKRFTSSFLSVSLWLS